MSAAPPPEPILAAPERLVMLIGAYGSGKTEVAVHLALRWARAGRRVQFVDLDLVNPYFRSREQRAVLEREGVRVVVPPGALAGADLPIVLPEVAGLLRPAEGTLSLFDVGGDDVGARVLSSFQPILKNAPYELWQVVNGSRPFTSDPAGCHAMRRDLEAATRLRVTGLVGNTHLIEQTTLETVLGGWRLLEQVSAESGLPVRAVGVTGALASDPALAAVGAPLLRIDRRMLPPWLPPTADGHAGCSGEPGTAARPRPLGVPPPLHVREPRGD